MAQDLQLAAAPLLPALDLDRPTHLGSLPSWLASRVVAEARSEHRRIVRDATGRQIGEVRTLPASLMLTGSMRAVLTRRVAELEAALEAGPAETILEAIGRLLTRYLRSHTDEDLSVRAETYLDALDSLPGWAVREAVRRWFQGKCGGTLKDYDFAPSEARLRLVAERIVDATKGQAICFRRLLAAEVEPQIPAAVREEQSDTLRGLVDGAGAASEPGGGEARPPAASEPPGDRSALKADLERRAQRRLEREAGGSVLGHEGQAVNPSSTGHR